MILNIKEILVIIAFCVVTVAYSVTAVLAYIRGKKKKADPAEVNASFADIAKNAIGLVGIAETAFKSVSQGGTLKLKDVLGDIKEQCEAAGIVFDKGYWTDLIGKSVDLLNYGRESEEKSEEKPTETVAEKQTPVV